ncbi:MAG: hypothetical protein ACXWQQ_04010 [Pseudobdellovibrio sp.]
MKDFFKIFLSLCALVAAFVIGKGYGEKTYLESDEYKKIAQTRDELDFTKNEIENAKAKLQNIVDAGDKQKTDELLGKLLDVFLTDLGLRIQNKELILKNAQLQAAAVAPKPAPPPIAINPPKDVKTDRAIEKLKKEEQNAEKLLAKMKSNEWMVLNADSKQEVLKDLDKVIIKNIQDGMFDDEIETIQCEKYVGDYRGPATSVTDQALGSFKFLMKRTSIGGGNLYTGNMEWTGDAFNTVTGKITNGCGHKIRGLDGRFFFLENGRYVQVYKLVQSGGLAGNIYEKLPNGATNRLAKFYLTRTDKF